MKGVNVDICSKSFKAHQGAVNRVLLSSDGNVAASTGADGKIRLWDLESQILKWEHGENGEPVEAIALTPRGHRVAAFGWPILRVWDVENEQLISEIVDYVDPVYAIALSTDGDRVLLGSWKPAVREYDAAFDGSLRWMIGRDEELCALGYVAENQRVVGIYRLGLVHVWGPNDVGVPYEYDFYENQVENSALASQAQCAVVGCSDGRVMMWDVAQICNSPESRGDEREVRAIEFVNNRLLAVSESDDGRLRVCDVLEDHERFKWSFNDEYAGHVALTVDGWLAVWKSGGSFIGAWHIDTGQRTDALPSLGLDRQSDVTVSRKYRKFLFCRNNDFEWPRRGEDCGREATASGGNEARATALSKNEEWVAKGFACGAVELWDRGEDVRIERFEGESECISTVSFCPNDRFLVSVSVNGTIRLWKIEGAELVARFTMDHGGHLSAVAADGSVAVVSRNDEIFLFELENYR